VTPISCFEWNTDKEPRAVIEAERIAPKTTVISVKLVKWFHLSDRSVENLQWN
jgi:hypothetical protein